MLAKFDATPYFHPHHTSIMGKFMKKCQPALL